MSQIVEEVLSANREYQVNFGNKGNIPLPPGRHFAILTCMDARLIPAHYAGLSEIVVPFVVTNTSNRTGNIFFNEFLLTDGQQRQYGEIDDLSYSLWRSEVRVKPRSEELYPGEHRMDVAAFIVAPDANTFSLHWKDQIISLTNKQQLKQQQSPQLTSSNTPTPEESQITTKVVNAKDGYANLRSQPSTEVSVVRTLQNGTQVKILDKQTNGDGQLWYKVQAEKQMGWIFSDLLN